MFNLRYKKLMFMRQSCMALPSHEEIIKKKEKD